MPNLWNKQVAEVRDIIRYCYAQGYWEEPDEEKADEVIEANVDRYYDELKPYLKTDKEANV